MSTTNTFYFDEIFPTYEEFKDFTDGLNLYKKDDSASELFNQYLFSLLYARYCGNSINYNVPQYFIYAFGLKYMDIFNQFKKRKELAETIEQLTVEDFETLTETISNGAFNPNDKPEEFWKPLGYISSQSATRLKSPKLVAYLNAIQTLPTRYIDAFLDNFIDLFTKFMPTGKYYYGD